MEWFESSGAVWWDAALRPVIDVIRPRSSQVAVEPTSVAHEPDAASSSTGLGGGVALEEQAEQTYEHMSIEDITDFTPADTPWERVKQAYCKELGQCGCKIDSGFYGVERELLYYVGGWTAGVGFVLGGVPTMKESTVRFKKHHGTTHFLNATDATKRHLDFILARFIRRGFRVGSRMSFGFTFPVLSVCVVSAAADRFHPHVIWPATAFPMALLSLVHGPTIMFYRSLFWTILYGGSTYLTCKAASLYLNKDMQQLYDMARIEFHRYQRAQRHREAAIRRIMEQEKIKWRPTAEKIYEQREAFVRQIRSEQQQTQRVADS